MLGVGENIKGTKCKAKKKGEKRKCDNEAKGIDGWPVVRSSAGKVILSKLPLLSCFWSM